MKSFLKIFIGMALILSLAIISYGFDIPARFKYKQVTRGDRRFLVNRFTGVPEFGWNKSGAGSRNFSNDFPVTDAGRGGWISLSPTSPQLSFEQAATSMQETFEQESTSTQETFDESDTSP